MKSIVPSLPVAKPKITPRIFPLLVPVGAGAAF
jgi:hypothetical protein